MSAAPCADARVAAGVGGTAIQRSGDECITRLVVDTLAVVAAALAEWLLDHDPVGRRWPELHDLVAACREALARVGAGR